MHFSVWRAKQKNIYSMIPFTETSEMKLWAKWNISSFRDAYIGGKTYKTRKEFSPQSSGSNLD